MFLCARARTHARTVEVGQVFIAKQKYDAIGTRSNHVLSFEKGEELEVLAPTPGAEWVEVRVCNEFLEY